MSTPHNFFSRYYRYTGYTSNNDQKKTWEKCVQDYKIFLDLYKNNFSPEITNHCSHYDLQGEIYIIGKVMNNYSYVHDVVLSDDIMGSYHPLYVYFHKEKENGTITGLLLSHTQLREENRNMVEIISEVERKNEDLAKLRNAQKVFHYKVTLKMEAMHYSQASNGPIGRNTFSSQMLFSLQESIKNNDFQFNKIIGDLCEIPRFFSSQKRLVEIMPFWENNFLWVKLTYKFSFRNDQKVTANKLREIIEWNIDYSLVDYWGLQSYLFNNNSTYFNIGRFQVLVTKLK